MRERLALAYARRAAALEAAHATAGRVELAAAEILARRRAAETQHAETAHDARLEDWHAAMGGDRFDLQMMSAHAIAIDRARSQALEAREALKLARDRAENCTSALSIAQARQRMADGRVRKLKRRLTKRAAERALTLLEAMTIMRWNKR